MLNIETPSYITSMFCPKLVYDIFSVTIFNCLKNKLFSQKLEQIRFPFPWSSKFNWVCIPLSQLHSLWLVTFLACIVELKALICLWSCLSCLYEVVSLHQVTLVASVSCTTKSNSWDKQLGTKVHCSLVFENNNEQEQCTSSAMTKDNYGHRQLKLNLRLTLPSTLVYIQVANRGILY